MISIPSTLAPAAPAAEGAAAPTAARGGKQRVETEVNATFAALLAGILVPAPAPDGAAAPPAEAGVAEGDESATDAPVGEGSLALLAAGPGAGPLATPRAAPAPEGAAPRGRSEAAQTAPAGGEARLPDGMRAVEARFLAAAAASGSGAAPDQPAGEIDELLAAAPPSAGTTGDRARRAHAHGGVDPRRVERNLELLVPEMRVRVERVVTRMREEFGHEVDVVETVRHQARQNFLFEQGRTRPGPVVTWTRASNHTEGRAVDVMIDGSYGNPAAYARLGRIATEEGLRTLGARDPGHLELPDGVGGARSFVAGAREAGAPAFAAAPVAEPRTTIAAAPPRGVAAVAPVAAVAAPAPVAPVAVAAAPAPVAAVAAVAVPGAGGGRGGAGRGGRDAGGEGSGSQPNPAPAPAPDRAPVPAYAGADALRSTAEAARPSFAESGSGVSAAARIAHLLDVQGAAPLRPLHQVLLRLDGPNGTDRIRLDLRGNTLGGSIALGDASAVEQLNARIGDLQRAMEHRGIDADALRVRTAAARADVVEITRAGATLVADTELQRLAVRATADTATARDRANPEHHHEPRQGSPESRQRSRREPKGDKNT